MLDDFKAFALRGNLIELGVGFIMGVTFTAVITSFVDDILMQLIAAIFGEQDFSGLAFTLNGSEIRYGSFLTALIVLLQVAVVLFFLLKGVDKLRRQNQEDETVEPSEDILLLREIRDALSTGTPVTGAAQDRRS